MTVAARALPAPFVRALFGAETLPAAALAPDGSLSFVSPEGSFARQTLSAGVSLLPSLDRSRALSFALAASQRFSLTGRGVVVGVIDTGIDLLHSDFRAPDGSSRVAWVIDYTQSPVGLHPALEARFALPFDGSLRGSVWSSQDLDLALRAGAPPTDDSDGHGTFVASIAAGNGRSTVPPRYIGIAPESSLVIVRAGSTEDFPISEASVLAGVAFVFDRADALGLPAVVNLSVGSHDGAHDGDSVFERSLEALCPPDRPGRALVASAGNDAQRPVHARVSLSPGSRATLPLWLPRGPAEGPPRLIGLSVSHSSPLSLALRLPDGAETPWVPSGTAMAFTLSGARVSLANATDGPSPRTGSRVATVLIASGHGSFALRPGGTWSLLLRGSGRADAYVFRDDGEGSGRAAFLNPEQLSEATVTLPASSESVISVGALSTRRLPASAPFSVHISPFSSRGPASDGALCPQLVAPGDTVFAARAHQPRNNPSSLFSEPSRLTPDGEHLGASGTSAAAPHVTGAVALLFQQDPTLSSREISSVLAASARPVTLSPRWNPSEGYGSLDVLSALELARALRAHGVNPPIDPEACSVTLAEPVISPDERTQLSVLLVTRDNTPALGEHRVTLAPSAGIASPARSLGAGRYALGYSSRGLDAPTTVTLRVFSDGLPLRALRLYVTRPRVQSTGGCECMSHPSNTPEFAMFSCVFLTAFARRARSNARGSTPARPALRSRRRGPRAPASPA